MKETKGGGLELEMSLGALEEIERWILSWGDHAKALTPKSLTDAVAKRIKAMGQQYR